MDLIVYKVGIIGGKKGGRKEEVKEIQFVSSLVALVCPVV